jgi:hypothetical protein
MIPRHVDLMDELLTAISTVERGKVLSVRRPCIFVDK